MNEKTGQSNYSKVRVTLYTRPRCHLCEEAKQAIIKANCTDDYDLEEINIDTDPVLVARYGLEIPVVCLNGIKTFIYHLNAEEFRSEVQRARRNAEPRMSS